MSHYLSSEERRSYKNVRIQAQTEANEMGCDFGLEFNKLFKEYNYFILPSEKNRCGFQLRCEVIRPIRDKMSTALTTAMSKAKAP